eukprot:164697_1
MASVGGHKSSQNYMKRIDTDQNHHHHLKRHTHARITAIIGEYHALYEDRNSGANIVIQIKSQIISELYEANRHRSKSSPPFETTYTCKNHSHHWRIPRFI